MIVATNLTENMEERVKELLNRILHPETQHGLVESGFVEQVSTPGDKITVTLNFAKVRDPFALKIKRQVQALLEENFPALKGSITVIIKEAAPKKPQAADKPTMTGDIAHIVAIASGKGGVGKSTVTANLAVALRNRGFRVGILDADIYGPSQPKMFGLEGYLPEAEQVDGQDIILPAEAMDMKIMSIGFFVKPSDALLWRGAMAVNALRQMIHQTRWGTLDFLLVDLPPGTGDIHLSIISELKIDTAVIVSTPQQIAVADVRRGVEMFRADKIEIPVVGIIENMAWFTPKELPENRYYIFGHGGARAFAEQNDVPFLGDIPIVQSVMDGSEEGRPAAGTDPAVESLYRSIAEKVVENMAKTC
jgi:ATP-binding protein involved in chromosome partitioning